MPRSRTIWKDGQLFAEYVDGKCVWVNPSYRPPARSELAAPMVMRDIGEYKSIIDGSMITSRSQHREHMRTHDVIEVGNERMPAAPSDQGIRPREIGEAIKRHLDEVKAAPQHAYDEHTKQQQAEHAAVASLVTATAA